MRICKAVVGIFSPYCPYYIVMRICKAVVGIFAFLILPILPILYWIVASTDRHEFYEFTIIPTLDIFSCLFA